MSLDVPHVAIGSLLLGTWVLLFENMGQRVMSFFLQGARWGVAGAVVGDVEEAGGEEDDDSFACSAWASGLAVSAVGGFFPCI